MIFLINFKDFLKAYSLSKICKIVLKYTLKCSSSGNKLILLTTRNVKLDSCSTMQFSDPMYFFFNFRWLTGQLEITIQMKKMLLVVNIWEQDLFLVGNTQNVENCPIKPFLATGTDEAKLNTTVAALWSTGMSVLFVA